MRVIKQTDKILSISHCDADGVAAQVVLGNVYPNIEYSIQQYVKIDEYLYSRVNYDAYDHIFITDIFPSIPKALDRSDKFIVLDHHETALPYHDPKKMRFIDTSMCATALTKLFLEKYYKIRLAHLDRYVELINDYDLWIHADPFSKSFNLIYDMYHDDRGRYRQRFMNGDVNLTAEEQNFIKQKKIEYKETYDSLELVEFEHIKGCLVLNSDKFINEICENLMQSEGYKIVFFRSTKNGHTSVRHCVNDLNIGELLTQQGLGGGHRKAGGMNELNSELLVKKILALEKLLFMNFPEVRRTEK